MNNLQLIKHRVNKAQDLSSVPVDCGVEIDLRSSVQKTGLLHLSHDPWIQGDGFEDWLTEFQKCGIKGPLILNTKEDGLEERILEILKSRKIENFFFLDTALPTLVRWTMHKNESRFAVRLSKYEPLESILPFSGKADWVWIDCFGGIPMSVTEIEKVKSHFKICLVSPELQGASVSQIVHFKNLSHTADAVCTKSETSWLTR